MEANMKIFNTFEGIDASILYSECIRRPLIGKC